MPTEPSINTCQLFGWVKDANDEPVVSGLVVLSHADFPHGDRLISGQRIEVRTDAVGFFDFGGVIETETVALAPYDVVVDGRRYTGIQVPDQASCALADLIPIAQVTAPLTASALSSLGELEQGRILSREMAFTFDSTSPVVVSGLLVGDIVDIVDIVIETAFDDVAATLVLKVGASVTLIAATENDPGAVGTYRGGEPYIVLAEDDLQIVIDPVDATTGAGRVLASIRRAG